MMMWKIKSIKISISNTIFFNIAVELSDNQSHEMIKKTSKTINK